ncbi:hypothetical protein [Paenibacillus hexagrammi]|uniref:Uncharacterized protein n=1 Tax=Paenibacillus hexagrammi TaxID=2908839 RepID=A0ABY3ST37_9BACL|nr:hypothetical protein [Paenibacillus sp. YPD9-1]UJF36540.1 hypothetical protein L0M14_30600 [Paenibacillus sp. YPD9-1]
MANSKDFEVVNLNGNEDALRRIRQLEAELAAELDMPIALIAYANDTETAKR